jgi:23S rRNA (adenine2503-C2)-methyltransferase
MVGDGPSVLEVLRRRGREGLATVRVGRLADGGLVEFVDSVQPPLPREEKWVLIVSTLRGCPVSCPICDAGGSYGGRLSAEEILAQMDLMVEERHPDRRVPTERLKVQFARMGDPALNPAVLDVLQQLPGRYDTPGLMPCVSTIAPEGCEDFMEGLAQIKRRHYSGGLFQMQLSIHTTCESRRRELVPAATWSFERMSRWCRGFRQPGDRKVTLNFAPVRGFPLEPLALAEVFSPEDCMVKLTPVNPTVASRASGLTGIVDPRRPAEAEAVAEGFVSAGFDTLVSIGELEENRIGSNCGMHVGSARAEHQTEPVALQ